MDSHDLLHVRSQSARIEGLCESIKDPDDLVQMLKEVLTDQESEDAIQGLAARSLASSIVKDKHSWEVTLERAIQAIVSIRATQTRSFEGETTSVYGATGFVVDKERGLILTNRHVVSCGPITAKVISG